MPSITLTFDSAASGRISAALATPENPSPSAEDVKQLLIRVLKTRVQRYEREQAATAVLDVT